MHTTLTDIVIGALLIVLGLSHILHARLWSEFFIDILAKPFGAFWIALFTMPVGLIIVITHNTWSLSPLVIVTVLGWGWVAKSAFYLLAPAVPVRLWQKRIRDPRSFVAGGWVAVVIGIAVLTARAWLSFDR